VVIIVFKVYQLRVDECVLDVSVTEELQRARRPISSALQALSPGPRKQEQSEETFFGKRRRTLEYVAWLDSGM